MQPNFQIYSASAGSGKTYTLAKSYIKLLIASKSNDSFRNILAITFTNKAVGEMKTRIIDMLKLFAAETKDAQSHAMFQDICKELQITAQHLQQKSKTVLNKIIHNYGAFDISTIDGFTHRVIRTFAFDLKLPVNFEVELDTDYLLTKAIDALIAKAGTDKKLTKTLVDFAIEKADDDKSWDIGSDFKKIGKLLLNENDLPYINKLKKKTLEDFATLKTELLKKIAITENEIVDIAEKTLNLISEAGLEFKDFSGSYFPKFLMNMKNKKLDVNFEGGWQTNLIEGVKLYPKTKVTDDVAQTIESLQPTLAQAFIKMKAAANNIKLNKAIYKNTTPLSVLASINKELTNIKDEENKLLISEFNSLISNEIKDQPTPFIYERLGEKFKHYFVDEFQDTSTMQWQNMHKLMDNAMSTLQGSTMIVGDAKQSIYRWRGGDAEQFIDLYQEKTNPFQINPKVENLESNFRSFRKIIEFNNSFFKFIAEDFLNAENYKELYNDASQKVEKEADGYVNISFIDYDKKEEGNVLYVEKTLEHIQSCLDNDYQLKDICVLVRKKKEGIAVSDYLTAQDIAIISSETLLLDNSPKVQLLNATLAFLVNPDDEKLKLNMLIGIAKQLNIENKHAFFSAYLKFETEELFKNLSEFDIHIDYLALLQMPIYELAESLVRGYKLCKTTADAYVQFYLDTILDFSNKQLSDILSFLDYYDTKKEKLSIAMPDNLDAVSIMTIHKSKGLEFPIVIFPFADLEIYREVEPKSWFPLDKTKYNGFENALIDYSKSVANYGDAGEEIHNVHESELQLDNINLLYVTLTRAVEQLYIITKNKPSKDGATKPKTYADLFINYLTFKNRWIEGESVYEDGKPFRKLEENNEAIVAEDYLFISTPKESHNLKVITNSGVLWETEQEKAIEYGNLVHLVMSKIFTKADIDSAIKSVVSSGQIEQSDISELERIVTQIVNHEKLSEYFTDKFSIYNERDILSKNGLFLRPDRLAIKDKNAVIIDYKTGSEDKKYEGQLESYAVVLREMDYIVEKKLIVYTNDTIKIIEVK